MPKFNETIHERYRPLAYHLDTDKVNRLKQERRLSIDAIARISGLTGRIIQMTIVNRSCGIKTQRAIAEALGVNLEDIVLNESGSQSGFTSLAASAK